MTRQARPGALRLVFESLGDDVRLIEAIPLDIVVPPGDEPDVDDTERAGFAARLYREDGTLLYRRIMADPRGREAEVWTGDPDRPWERSTVELGPVQFDIVVPSTGEDDVIELVASPPRERLESTREAGRAILRARVRGGSTYTGGPEPRA